MLGIVDSIVGVAGKVLDKFVEDKDLKTRLDFELRKAYADANLGQIEINTVFVLLNQKPFSKSRRNDPS